MLRFSKHSELFSAPASTVEPAAEHGEVFTAYSCQNTSRKVLNSALSSGKFISLPFNFWLFI
jgi:hypothetical protein